MKKHSLGTAAAASLLWASAALAVPQSINLTFSGPGTGFDGVYNDDPTHYSVGPGGLTLRSQPGDIFGQYDETTVNSAKNVMYSLLDPTGVTVLTSHVTVSGLNQNFQGGGIWMGMDENHYIRLGIINNTFAGGLTAEGLREDLDLWGGVGGPGGDIVGHDIGKIGDSPQTTPMDVLLQIVRTGTNATASVSINGGPLTVVGNYDNVLSDPAASTHYSTDPQDVPHQFKVGVYAFGGDGGNPPPEATYVFHDFSAVPEPTTMAMSLLGLLPMLARRRSK